MLKVVYLSLWNGRLCDGKDEFFKKLALDTDVFCFQGINRSYCGTIRCTDPLTLSSDARKAGAIFAGQYDHLAKILPSYDGFYLAHFQGLHDKAPAKEAIDFGIAIFVRKRLRKIYRDGFIWGGFDATMKPSNIPPRGLQTLGLIKDDRPYLIVNFHGLHEEKTRQSPAKNDQTSNLIEFIESAYREINDSVDREVEVIFGGDFGFNATIPSFHKLKESTSAFGYQPAINLNERFKIADTRTRWYPAEMSVRDTDMVLVSENLNVEDLELVIDPVVSDHCPLILTCE